jgi:hypothetical protein
MTSRSPPPDGPVKPGHDKKRPADAALTIAPAREVWEEVTAEALHPHPPSKGHWAQAADRLARLNALEGRSEGLRRHVREFRDGFGLWKPEPPAG